MVRAAGKRFTPDRCATCFQRGFFLLVLPVRADPVASASVQFGRTFASRCRGVARGASRPPCRATVMSAGARDEPDTAFQNARGTQRLKRAASDDQS